MTEGKKPRAVTPRIHPEERPKVAALNKMARLFQDAPEIKQNLSYYSPILIQCTLPHSDPKHHAWVRTNGSRSLILASGVNEKGEHTGLPYGSFPRLVLAYIITKVTQTGARKIALSSHFSTFLKEVGYTSNHKGRGIKGTRLREQLIRLLRASITFQKTGEGHLSVDDVKIAPKFELWFDANNPDAGSLLGSHITISEEFRESILRAPVPLRTDILAALKKSPLALDVYMWVSYRLFQMHVNKQEQVTLNYGQLQSQFGTGISEENYRKFRQEIKLAFHKVAEQWSTPDGVKQTLHFEFEENRMTLFQSLLIVQKPKKVAAAKLHNERTAILEQRSFDIETYRQARQFAGKWDVRYLSEQYFSWIEAEDILPNNPVAHFLNFVRRHCERNASP
jgi:hypothetical protein